METMKRKTASRDLDAVIGERVHVLMWRQGITLKSIADRIGVDAGGLGKKLKGQRGFASQEIADLASVLGVSVGFLFGETKEAPTPESEGQPSHLSESNRRPIHYKSNVTPLPVRRVVAFERSGLATVTPIRATA